MKLKIPIKLLIILNFAPQKNNTFTFKCDSYRKMVYEHIN